jgi:hydroxyacylglutathione hydrolase
VLIETVAVGPFQANAYLLADETAGVAVLIDPGEEGARLVRLVAERQLRLEAIWLTHAHVDHVGGIAAVKRALDVPIHLHSLDRPMYDRTEELGRMFGLRVEQPPPPDAELSDGQELSLGALRFAVMHTPGHAPGHVVLHGHGVAFVGDCLFAGSVGRTDLPLCNGNDLARSLERISSLPGETVIYPGHGAASTIERERVENPFLNGTLRITGAG